jgi:DNA replication ATP-dependent helicase Dna2
MQGQSVEVVLVSLCASDSVYLGQVTDFFFSPNRWNVALSRARTKVIVVGSKYLAQALPAYGDASRSLWHALLLAHSVAIKDSASTDLE